MIKKQELVSFYTHFIAAIASITGTFILWFTSANITSLKMSLLIYGISISFLFSASSIYHWRKKDENDNSFWRKLDHFAIFVMIAGTYTPVCYFYLEGAPLYTILGIQWGLVLIGAFFKFFYLNAPRFFSTLIYLIMGWMAIIVAKYLLVLMPLSQFIFILGGGVAFTAGAVLYALKRPVIIPERFGFHELFHIFTIIGASLHYTVVIRAALSA